jgi:lipoyl(octanoyl) transferase
MIEVSWRGRIGYAQALEQQRKRRTRILAREAGECVWLLEHPPVVTVGRRRVEDLPHPRDLSRLGLKLYATERGGLATYHGPGQLVGYFLIDIASRGIKVREMVYSIEDGVISWLAAYGVQAARRAGFPGVWVGGAKICALGLHFRKGVSMHGFALNLSTEMAGFASITPCGITDAGITSLYLETGRTVAPADAAFPVAARIIEALRLTPNARADNGVGLEGM